MSFSLIVASSEPGDINLPNLCGYPQADTSLFANGLAKRHTARQWAAWMCVLWWGRTVPREALLLGTEQCLLFACGVEWFLQWLGFCCCFSCVTSHLNHLPFSYICQHTSQGRAPRRGIFFFSGNSTKMYTLSWSIQYSRSLDFIHDFKTHGQKVCFNSIRLFSSRRITRFFRSIAIDLG